MKKMIVSLMLILSMFAFAAESDPSATVGYVKYDLLQPGGYSTGLNMIALPFDESYANTTALGGAITNCDQVNTYEANLQAWKTSSKGAFGWSNVFNVAAGNAYLINVTGASEFISNGELQTYSPYNLVQPAGYSTGLNLIMQPLTKGGDALNSSSEIGADITNCDQVNSYDALTQAWKTSSKGAFGWSNVFATDIAMGLHVNVTADATWPSVKVEDNNELSNPSEDPKGVARNVMYMVKDASDAYYDFSAMPYDNILYRGWITTRPGEVLDHTNGGSGYETFGAGFSFVFINIGNFPTPWAAGDTVTFRIQQVDDRTAPLPFPIFEEFVTTSALDGGNGDYYGGAGTILGDPTLGDPILMNDPSSIEDVAIPTVTKLHQNYPNPFNPTTTIKFDLSSNTDVKLNVYNYNGQMVKSLVNTTMNAGYHSVNFDAASLSAGVYYYTLEANNKVMTNKMVLVK